jgi:hypothetical protein
VGGADVEHGGGEVAQHDGDLLAGRRRRRDGLLQRHVEQHLVVVSLADRGRARRRPVVPVQRIPGQQEDPQPRGDPRPDVIQLWPPQAQLQQHALLLGRALEHLAQSCGNPGQHGAQKSHDGSDLTARCAA